MRIGLGAPADGVPGVGVGAVINLFKNDSWLSLRPDGRPAERIAIGWKWDGAGTTLHLTLRPGVYFHDGSLLTPDIAAQALRKTASGSDGAFASVTSVAPSGNDAVDIHLKERNAFILTELAGAMVVKPDNAKVGTGPFKLESQDEDGGVLTAFPKYYRGSPALAGVTVTNYPTQRKAWAAMMRGEIDMLYEVSRDAADFVEAEKTVRAYSFPRPYYIPLVFNVRHPLLKNPEVRRAIDQAIDREAVVRDGMAGRGKPADGPILPQNWAYSPPPVPAAFNPAEARLRLQKLAPGPGNKSEGGPAKLTFTCLVFANDPRFERLASVVQKQLADIGIDMKLQPVSQKELIKRVGAGEFDAYLFEASGRALNRVYEFWHYREGGFNNTGYRSADDVLDRIRGTLSDDATIRKQVAELQRVLHEDPPAIFLAWPVTSRAVSRRFDVAPEPNRDILANVWQWRMSAAGQQAAR